MEPNRGSLQKPRGGRLFRPSLNALQSRTMRMAQKFDGDTQKTRAQLILDLQSLLEVAKEHVLSTRTKKTKEHRDWARLAAYLSQVINSVSKTYDIAQIKRELDTLRKTIEEMNQKRASTNEK